VRNEDVIRLAGINETEFKAIFDSELAEIEWRRQRYLGDRERINVNGKDGDCDRRWHRHRRDDSRSFARHPDA
jgi:hypothetical protein